MKHLLIALQFLTILPTKIKEIGEKDFGKSLLYFPVIGLFIGLILSVTLFLLGFLPSLIVGVFILIVSILITGGIHLDGFADTCDGFYGSRNKEEILEIMKDSRVGVMGVIGIICILLLKFTLIVSIPTQFLWRSLIMMAAFSRWVQVLACYSSSYARKEGKARYFIEYAGKKEVLIGMIFTLILFSFLARFGGLAIFIISLIPVFLFIYFCKRKIGGMTGDTIGAANEIAEVTVLFTSVIILCIY